MRVLLLTWRDIRSSRAGGAEVLTCVACAVRERWGLTTTEAARLGTPAVTYDVLGLRDSVVDGQTGLRTKSTPKALAAGARRVLDDRPPCDAFRKAASERWRHVGWISTAESFDRRLFSTSSGRKSYVDS